MVTEFELEKRIEVLESLGYESTSWLFEDEVVHGYKLEVVMDDYFVTSRISIFELYNIINFDEYIANDFKKIYKYLYNIATGNIEQEVYYEWKRNLSIF